MNDTGKRLRREDDERESWLAKEAEERKESSTATTASSLSRLGLEDAPSEPHTGKIIVRVNAPRAASPLQEIERLFSAAPMIEAPSGFADRMMALIAEKAAQANSLTKRRRRWRWPWFILITAILFIGGVAGLALGPGPRAIALLLQQATTWLNEVAHELSLTIAALGTAASAYSAGPLFTAGILTAMFVVIAAWGWLMTYASLNRQQVVYQVPVRFH